MTKIIFKLTETLARKLKAKGKYHGACYNCGKPFQIGDLVVSKYSGNNQRRKWYCVNCARKLKIL